MRRTETVLLILVGVILSICGNAGANQQASSKYTIVPGERVGDYILGMSKDDVLKKLGEPDSIQLVEGEVIHRGQEDYNLNNLPGNCILTFGDISFWIKDDSVEMIGVRSPLYKLDNELKVGDSVQRIKQALGEDCQLEEDMGKDYLGYKSIWLAFEINKENQTAVEILTCRPQRNHGDVSDQQEQSPQIIVPGLSIGDYTLGMSKDKVLGRLGEPESIFWGQERYTIDNLPRSYFMSFRHLISFCIVDDSVTGISVFGPPYKFANGLEVGDSEQKIKEAFGGDFKLEEFERIDVIIYEQKGIRFEINKNDRTVEEINVIQKTSRGRESFSASPVQSIEPFDNVRSKDLSKLDLSARKGLIATLQFNQETIWPEQDKMPPGSSPEKTLADAMNPGLGVRQLHKQGITGKGVNVAIIDQPLFKDHPEYDGKIVAYHDTGCETDESTYHGPAVASLLVGTNCGTAPDARIYYAAAPSWKADSAYYARGLDWIIEQNEKLPKGEKIRVVSVSAAPSGRGSPFKKNREMWDEACARAKADGIMVLDCTNSHRGFINRGWYDPENPESVTRFNLGPPPKRQVRVDMTEAGLFVPSSCRTVAQQGDLPGRNSYIYCGRGGLSWSIPYCAGVLAMGWQVRPDLNPERMEELLFASAHVHESGARIIHPAAFIDLIRKQDNN